MIHDIFLIVIVFAMIILGYLFTRPPRRIKIPGLKPFYCSRCGQIIQIDESIFEGGRCWKCHKIWRAGRMN